MLSVVAYLTPAGTLDEGGVVQPAYINFDADLLSPPAGAMKVCAPLTCFRLLADTNSTACWDRL